MAKHKNGVASRPWGLPAGVTPTHHPLMEALTRESGQGKWFNFSVVFPQPLTRLEERWFVSALQETLYLERGDVPAGQDGIRDEQFPESYPSPGDVYLLIRAIESAGVPALVRMAPYGRNCPAHEECNPHHRCLVGDCMSCHPVWRDSDWHPVGDVNAEEMRRMIARVS